MLQLQPIHAGTCGTPHAAAGLPIRSEGPEQRLRRRGDVHVLLLGDPGLGKSELLRALARLSHRGRGPVLLDVSRINNNPLVY